MYAFKYAMMYVMLLFTCIILRASKMGHSNKYTMQQN